MSVNLYGNIGTTYSGIVTGAELERVSQEIFGGAQVKAPEKTVQPAQVQSQQTVQPTNESQISLYARKTDINFTQQVAQAKVDFNVQLSPQALQNIEALKTLAATQQMNVHKLNEGKIYVPVENAQKSDIEVAFALSHPTTISKSLNLEKDRKGSNPFAYQQPSQKEESAGSPSAINIVA